MATNLKKFSLILIHFFRINLAREMEYRENFLFMLVIDVFTRTNLLRFPQMVLRGDLDYLLVKPLDSMFHVSVSDISTSPILALSSAGWGPSSMSSLNII